MRALEAKRSRSSSRRGSNSEQLVIIGERVFTDVDVDVDVEVDTDGLVDVDVDADDDDAEVEGDVVPEANGVLLGKEDAFCPGIEVVTPV